MMTMMAKIVKSAYVKFGVRKTNNAMSAITSACAVVTVVTVVAAIGMARYVGYVNGFEDAADQLCV